MSDTKLSRKKKQQQQKLFDLALLEIEHQKGGEEEETQKSGSTPFNGKSGSKDTQQSATDPDRVENEMSASPRELLETLLQHYETLIVSLGTSFYRALCFEGRFDAKGTGDFSFRGPRISKDLPRRTFTGGSIKESLPPCKCHFGPGENVGFPPIDDEGNQLQGETHTHNFKRFKLLMPPRINFPGDCPATADYCTFDYVCEIEQSIGSRDVLVQGLSALLQLMLESHPTRESAARVEGTPLLADIASRAVAARSIGLLRFIYGPLSDHFPQLHPSRNDTDEARYRNLRNAIQSVVQDPVAGRKRGATTDPDIVQILLDNGADPWARTRDLKFHLLELFIDGVCIDLATRAAIAKSLLDCAARRENETEEEWPPIVEQRGRRHPHGIVTEARVPLLQMRNQYGVSVPLCLVLTDQAEFLTKPGFLEHGHTLDSKQTIRNDEAQDTLLHIAVKNCERTSNDIQVSKLTRSLRSLEFLLEFLTTLSHERRLFARDLRAGGDGSMEAVTLSELMELRNAENLTPRNLVKHTKREVDPVLERFLLKERTGG